MQLKSWHLTVKYRTTQFVILLRTSLTCAGLLLFACDVQDRKQQLGEAGEEMHAGQQSQSGVS